MKHIKQTLADISVYAKTFAYWLVLAILLGGLCGALGVVFSHSISFVTRIRTEHAWLIFLLPVLGLVSVWIYHLCKVTGIGTDRVFESVRGEKELPLLLAPAIFIGSTITHLGGGSAGREGAALQLGGSVSTALSKLLRLDEKTQHILTICGMGALFSAVFGTPLGACVFALEVVHVGYMYSAAIFPAFVSSLTAYAVSSALGVKAERFDLSHIPAFDVDILWRVMLIIIAGSIVSALFCRVMHTSQKWLAKILPNDYIRIMVGGAAIVFLTWICGTTDYNGSGMDVIERIFTQNEVHHEYFVIKILFTAITIGCGFKGGEIIPTMFIGATLGSSMASLLNLSPSFGAAIGIAALFCGVTNCPFATLFLCVEMFGANGLSFWAIACFTSFLLSGYTSLYHGQRLAFSKLREEMFE